MKFENDYLDKLNALIRKTLDDYYHYGEADDFFKIDYLLRECMKHGYTKDEIPALIEMQNVLVMG